MSEAKPETLGKYEIRGTLGRGAMGVVYDAWDPVIARRVAIKTIRLPEADDAEAQDLFARFRREAQAAGRLTHPNIVGVFDYAESDGIAYIVMEFVEGRTLKSVIDAGERMAVPDVVRVMQEVLAGLAFSHARGVIHRDIKPANILLTAEGQAKIADFGIARIDSTSLTQVGTVMGTPAYMSPEQFMGQTVDARTDLYSSGVLLYQLLTGERPFDGSPTAIMHKVLNTTPPRPSALSVTVPRSLDAVTERAMARRPEDRYPTAAAFADALGRWADTAPEPMGGDPDATMIQSDATVIGTRVMQPPPAPPAPPAPTTASAPTPSVASPSVASPPAAGGGRTAMIAAIVVMLGLAGGGAFWLMTGGGQRPTTTAERPATPPSAAPQPAAPQPAAPQAAAPQPAPPTTAAPQSVPAPAASPNPAPAPAAASAPPAPPAATPAAPTLPSPARLQAQLAAAIAPIPCQIASASVAGPNDAAVVSGLAGAGKPELALHAAVADVIGGLPLNEPVDWRLQTFGNPDYCTALDIVRPFAARRAGAAGQPFAIGLPQSSFRLATNDLLKLSVTMPAAPAWLQIDYLQSDGKVWHMVPSTDEPARLLAADARTIIGEPRKGFGGWEISAPYGRDMIVAVASSQPLFSKKRPQAEDTAAYLVALKSAIAIAEDHNVQLFADAIVLDTVDRP